MTLSSGASGCGKRIEVIQNDVIVVVYSIAIFIMTRDPERRNKRIKRMNE